MLVSPLYLSFYSFATRGFVRQHANMSLREIIFIDFIDFVLQNARRIRRSTELMDQFDLDRMSTRAEVQASFRLCFPDVDIGFRLVVDALVSVD